MIQMKKMPIKKTLESIKKLSYAANKLQKERKKETKKETKKEENYYNFFYNSLNQQNPVDFIDFL